jgi:outer membrane biogenesis lipoprotein LolB
MRHMKKFIYSIVLAFLFLGCKSTKTLQSSQALDSKMSVKQIVKKHNKSHSEFNTLQGRLKVEYTQGDRSETHTLTLRMEYDKTIWVNAFLNMVRIKITPEHVRFYNKLDNTYFDGDYDLISEFLGTNLQFENLQNLLLGEAIFNLKSKEFKKQSHPNSYELTPKRSNALFDLLYLINPTYFKLDAQQVSQTLEQNVLKIRYQSYQEVGGWVLPENMVITATNTNEQTTLNLNIKSVSLDQPLRFPFNIPKGFKAIELK